MLIAWIVLTACNVLLLAECWRQGRVIARQRAALRRYERGRLRHYVAERW
jgi:hypothetical protein